MLKRVLAGAAIVMITATTTTAAHASDRYIDGAGADPDKYEITIDGKIIEPTSTEAEGGAGDKRTGVVPQPDPIIIGLCNAGLGETTIASYNSLKDGVVDLKCGDSKSGYVHIREEHEDDWEKRKKGWPGYWDDLMVQAVKESVENGHMTLNQGNGKRCYAGTVQIKYDGELVDEFYPTTIVSMNNKKIITSIPTSNHRCVP